MGAIVLLLAGGFINLFTVTFWLKWRQLVLIFFSSSFPPPFFFISCAFPCGGQREYLTKYFSLNQVERKGGFQGQLQCKMPFMTSIILSSSSALRGEGLFSMTPITIHSLTQDFSIQACICSHSEVPDLSQCCFGDVGFWPLGNYPELHEFLHPSLHLLQLVVTICLMLC